MVVSFFCTFVAEVWILEPQCVGLLLVAEITWVKFLYMCARARIFVQHVLHMALSPHEDLFSFKPHFLIGESLCPLWFVLTSLISRRRCVHQESGKTSERGGYAFWGLLVSVFEPFFTYFSIRPQAQKSPQLTQNCGDILLLQLL